MEQDIDEQIAVKIEELRGYRETHFDIAMRLFKPGSSTHPIDILAHVSLNRSLQLTYAFCDLICNRQSLAAMPLLRCQLDNALRFSALYLVDKPQDVANDMISGKSLRNMSDMNGAKLTDNHLVAQFKAVQPWVKPLYDQASGFIHLSEQHVSSALQITDRPDELPGYFTFSGTISEQDVIVPSKFRLDLLLAFQASTDLFFEQVNGWADIKETLPDIPEPGDA